MKALSKLSRPLRSAGWDQRALWSFSLLSTPDIQVEHIRWMIFSGNNTIPFPNQKQDGLLFKTSGLEKKWKFLKRHNSTICLKFNESAIHRQASSCAYRYDFSISSKLKQKRAEWCFKYRTGLSQPNPKTLSCFLRTSSLCAICFPVPSVLEKPMYLPTGRRNDTSSDKPSWTF